jgi:predicted DNA binding CopG/RHH family protein
MVLKQYPMRVEEEVWRRVKAKAALEGMTIKEAIERLLRGWVDGKLKIEKK